MRKGNVTVDVIVCDRECHATDAEIKALAEDIRDNGMSNPILAVEDSLELIDGLTRVKAYELLGWSVVPALFATTHSEAADVLEKIRHGKMLSYQRGMEVFRVLKILGKKATLQRRRVPRGTKKPPAEQVRSAASRATGMSENAINRISVLENLANNGNVEAIQIVTDIFASPPGSRIIGFSRALSLNRTRSMLEMPAPERMKAISDVLQATEKSLEQVDRVGGLNLLPPEDAGTVIARLSDIARLATKIRNETKRSMQ